MLSTPPRLMRATASLTDAATPPATLAQPSESGTFSTKRAPFFIFIAKFIIPNANPTKKSMASFFDKATSY
jgi:hypothetical protein